MSFIARIAPVARTASAALKPTAPSISIGATRALSSSACLNKGPVESAKDTLKAADRTVSDAAVKGIEVGETAAEKLKGTVGAASGQAQAKTGELQGDAAELAGKSKGKAEEALGQAKGAAGQAKGKTDELLGEAKGKAKETAGRF
ncbi:uncharacterized protein BO95DRAFT_443462 [Aspergillus brunneoviolaceus CBS 621.78]|uniref:Uncharacterized protein n=1 Tax=Aspergillus brunneoviolaceus CBS 621.78 TaxID=1450534 RepID=A0ACD1G6U5_9EURO|nr:hypothetical protein BO95DRAFT_443462 [Aspergillus brunneoviolaceus CBS 621.78]RAH45014.1 hypothetical protein BO95DRAFT_443462 [Aspergillus brunneoviolaceus CBS 621.78]